MLIRAGASDYITDFGPRSLSVVDNSGSGDIRQNEIDRRKYIFFFIIYKINRKK